MNFTNIPEMIRDRAGKYQNKEVFRYRAKESNTIHSKSWTELVEEFTQLSEVRPIQMVQRLRWKPDTLRPVHTSQQQSC